MLTVLLFALLSQAPPKPVPADGIRFHPESVAPKPAPVSPDAPTLLRAGEMCVFESNDEMFFRATPSGIVKVKRVTGPRSFYAPIAGGDGEPVEQDFAGKFLLVVTPIVSGRCELIIVPKGVVDDKKIVTKIIESQVGPRPPPDPQPDPKPQPKPEPTAQKLFVSVWHVKANVDPSLENVILSKAVRDYCAGKGHSVRVYSDPLAEPDKFNQFKPVIDKAGGMPCLVLQTKTGNAAGERVLLAVPMPTTEADFLATLKKFGGN